MWRGSRLWRICGRQLLAPHDRTRDEVREERQVDGQVHRAGGRELLPVDVDHVADRHEREEGDPDRQQDLLERQDVPR